jgi:excinuclease ABC subunit A
VIDLGPGAGEHGGNVVASGTIKDILESKDSLTGNISGGTEDPVPKKRRPVDGNKSWRSSGQGNITLRTWM